MKICLNNTDFSFDVSQPVCISIPVNFYGDQPNTYNVPKASAKAFESSGFIGDTRKGGGCNFEAFRMIPHCNGTHTECIGHISFDRIFINDVLKDSFIPSTLITVAPENAFDTSDNYEPGKNETDMLITKKILEYKLRNADAEFLQGLLIRTLPNDDSKKSRQYMNNLPPFFSIEAMEYIASLNVNHLMIDIPSVDRTFDEGKLTAHHIFWNVKKESHDVNIKIHSMKTITEMIYVPETVKDGICIACIQIPDLCSDAAPSRILIYKINNS